MRNKFKQLVMRGKGGCCWYFTQKAMVEGIISGKQSEVVRGAGMWGGSVSLVLNGHVLLHQLHSGSSLTFGCSRFMFLWVVLFLLSLFSRLLNSEEAEQGEDPFLHHFEDGSNS